MKSHFAVAILLLTAILLVDAQLGPNVTSNTPVQPKDPIIGILTQPNVHSWDEPCPSYVQQTYVDWLAQAGIRVVPLWYTDSRESLRETMGYLNGVLFTGGMQNTSIDSPFYDAAKFIVDYALEQNARGEKFVLWGTCQGFQLITMSVAQTHSVMTCDYVGTMTSMLPLQMTPAANSSVILSQLPISSPLLYADMTTKNTTANGHNCGIDPVHFQTNPYLRGNFTVISTNVDTTGKPFASTFEHKTAEIYALQWHPEGAQFWYDMGFNKDPSTIRVSQYMANFIVSRLRMNNRSYPTPQDGISALIPQYSLRHKPNDQYSGFYCFGVPNRRDVEASQRTWMVVAIVAIVAFFASLVYLWSKTSSKGTKQAKEAAARPDKKGYDAIQAAV